MVVEVKVLYHLLSDRNTPVSKVLSTDISVIRALEANHDLQPRVHPEPWPSFFTVDTLQEKNDEVAIPKAVGVTQKWELVVRLGSFAEEDLIIKNIVPVIDGTIAGSATFSELSGSTESTSLPSRGLIERSFVVDITKASLEERRPTTLSLSARIEWQRAEAPDQTPVTTTVLQFSDIVVPNSEPRVICTAQLAPNPSTPGLMQLDYTLENPTFHFLTFDLTMEASEDFAFSGPKFGAVNLLPLSRTRVKFEILPLIRGDWINPGLKVMDRWFGKQLRVLAGEGCRNDKKGIAVWVDEEDDAE
jgi:solute carrier family 25 protein 38